MCGRHITRPDIAAPNKVHTHTHTHALTYALVHICPGVYILIRTDNVSKIIKIVLFLVVSMRKHS